MSEKSQERFSRRAALMLLAASAAITVLGRDARAQAKVSKTAVKYQDGPKDGQRCSGCIHFISSGQCKIVEGEVSPDGWCMAYSPKR